MANWSDQTNGEKSNKESGKHYQMKQTSSSNNHQQPPQNGGGGGLFFQIIIGTILVGLLLAVIGLFVESPNFQRNSPNTKPQQDVEYYQ